MDNKLSLVWQKAAIVGSLWGAFEIVAGSFIHNLALPLLAGTILSFTGVLIAIAFQSRWRTPGLLWRAGLICALLKSVSPSAIILTPMLGITLEGFLLEIGTLLFGINITGFIVGGGFAVISVLLFKVVRLLLVYGQGVIDAYSSVYKLSIAQLKLNSNSNAWWPILAIALIYFIIGSIAAILGIYAGKKLSQSVLDSYNSINYSNVENVEKAKSSSVKTFIAPFTHLIFLVSILSLQFNINVLVSVSISLLYILFCIIRYPKVKFILSKLGFWIPIVIFSFIIPLITFQNSSDFGWFIDGIKILSRATTVIISFSAIGTELSNSNARIFFKNGRFATVYQATSLAFSTLPNYIEHLKGMKFEARRPERFISRFVNEAINKNQNVEPRNYPVIIVTADRGSGKTTFIKEIVSILDEKKIPLTGFYAEGTWDSNHVRNTFSLTLLPSRESTMLCDSSTISWILQGRFRFNPNTLAKGNNAIKSAIKDSVVVIDEVGILELNGNIWSDALTEIINRDKNPVIISVRRHFLEDVKGKWNLGNAIIFDATADCPEDAVKIVVR